MKVRVLAFSVFFVGVILLASFIASGQSVPQLINYQGRLMDKSANEPINGPTNFVFKLFAVTGGDTLSPTELWSETRTVTVDQGIYNVMLGSVTPIPADAFNGPERYLRVEVEGEPLGPVQRLVSVPYAMAVDLNYLYSQKDFDGDGHDSILFGGDDCDDTNASAYPGAVEIPLDGIDQSCDGYAFGAKDVCLKMDSCGAFEDDEDGMGAEACEIDVNNWIEWGFSWPFDLADCIEAATCPGIGSCMDITAVDISDSFCSTLQACSYMDYFDCQDEVDMSWDGWHNQLIVPTACINEDGTCQAEVIEQCLSLELFGYKKSVQLPWGNFNTGISIEVSVIFSDTSESFSVRSPRGVEYSLQNDEPWFWEYYNNSYASFEELTSAWPSGIYTLLKNGATVETFTAPPYNESLFPANFYAEFPPSGSPVNGDTLTFQWQFTNGPNPAYLELHLHNWTRGGYLDTRGLDGDATIGSIGITPGALAGDSVSLDIVGYTRMEMFIAPLTSFFERDFETRKSPIYTWTGP